MTRLRRLRKTRAVAGLAGAQLRHDRARTVLAVVGVALAVLATTLLASVGAGVLATGQETFDAADRDLWLTGGPVRLAPGSVGGIDNSLRDVHDLAAELAAREEIRTAAPLSFQTVYVGSEPDDLRTLVGAGSLGASGSSVRITEGRGFGRSPHYAGGSYDGPTLDEVVVDPRTAELLDVGVGDTIYVGGTTLGARDNPVTVVGVSPTFSRFLGAPTVTMPLAELQTLTGTAAADSATLLTLSLAPGADVRSVEADLQAAYPEYDVRTNQEQLRAVVADKALVLAAGVVLTVLAVVTGLALTVNLLALLVYQQRRAIAAVRALGVSTTTLVGMVVVQGLVLGVLGGALGLGLTVPLAEALNLVAAELVGFEGLVRTPTVVFVAGGALAVVVGSLSAAVAGWRVARGSPLATLRG